MNMENSKMSESHTQAKFKQTCCSLKPIYLVYVKKYKTTVQKQ